MPGGTPGTTSDVPDTLAVPMSDRPGAVPAKSW